MPPGYDADRRKVQPVRRFHRPVRRRHLGAGRACAASGRLHTCAGRGRRLPAAHHRRPGQRCPDPAVRRLRAGDDGLPRKAQPMAGVRLEARLRRLLPGATGRLRTRQHHQRAADRPARAGRRGAGFAYAAGAGAARNLAGSQRTSLVLSGTAVLGGQGRPGEAGLADGPGPHIRRPDGRHRPVVGRADAAGVERPGYPAMAGHADDATAHRRRRIGDRRRRGERRHTATHRRAAGA